MFKQALLNLLLNAEQAMPEGGEITIQAARNAEWGRGNAERKADSAFPIPHSAIELSVIDTGKGMPPEVAARAFRPFYSNRPGGTGLGLPTARKIIEAHGGTIELQSEPGRGTKFTIRLPAAEE
jgi:signal transduction histidine kinase